MNVIRWTLAIACASLISACGASAGGDAALTVDASGLPPEDLAVAAPVDLSVGDSSAAVDAGGDPLLGWALYTIEPGAHSATVKNGVANNPISPLGGGRGGRDFQFVFDPSAAYTIVNPTQPEDQLDWNKLPGLSDCDQVDLSVDGVMFGWRYRLDLQPKVLEVTAYANNARKHLWPNALLFTLDDNDLASRAPLRYRLWMDGDLYRFSVEGTVRGRVIAAQTTLPRRCASTAPDRIVIQWASGFYFGGTSTAPSRITGRIAEIPFR